jgi:hypothetical protein
MASFITSKPTSLNLHDAPVKSDILDLSDGRKISIELKKMKEEKRNGTKKTTRQP